MRKSERAKNLKKNFATVLIAISMLGFLVSGVMAMWLSFPNLDKKFASEADKTYVSYIEQGNAYYSRYMYDDSIVEFDKALTIHDDDPYLYALRAQSYKMKGKYEKAIAEAKKGIRVLDNKSVYYGIKGYYKFQPKSPESRNKSIASYLYLYWAGSAMKLKRYDEAIEGYTGLIANVKYTYSTEAYFKRGLCYYYSGDIKSALEDFYRHKEVINQYFKDNTDNLYAQYSDKDVKKIDKWIKHCENKLGIKSASESEPSNGTILPPDI